MAGITNDLEANQNQSTKRILAKIRSNLSLKLLLSFLIGSFLLVLVLAFVAREGIDNNLRHRVKPLLNHYLYLLDKEVGNPPDINKAKTISSDWPLTIRVFSPTENWASDNIIKEPGLWRHGEDDSDNRTFYYDHDKIFVKRQHPQAVLYYGIEKPSRVSAIPIVIIVIVLIALLGFYYLIRWMFSPIRHIQQAVRKIGAGELNQRIKLKRTDELGQLAISINAMTDELESMMQAKRDLLLAISHELRSPLARSRVKLDLLNDRKQAADLLADQEEMERLISLILDAERLYSDHAVVHKTPVHIDELIGELIAEQYAEEEIEIISEAAVTFINLDDKQIKILLKNLIDNALRYNRAEQCKVQVQSQLIDKEFRLSVIDCGSGINSRHLSQLTKAFYRTDSSRQRKSGGLGLGLYLCNAIALAHGGYLDIASSKTGSRVSFVLGID